MKIIHCCLACFYIDGYGYQENILPKMHKLQGHEVQILASTETFIDNMNLGYLKPSSYHTEQGIPISRIPYVKWLPHFIGKKLRLYPGVFKIIESFQPDIIFLHDIQFLSILEIVKYAKLKKNVKIYADGHTDFVNSARSWLSEKILHKYIYKMCAKAIEPYTKKFYGVLPLRVDFFKDVYKIPPDKVELLLLGADLTSIEFNKKDEIRIAIRNVHNIRQSDFVIITGGKIDIDKNIHLLIQSINALANENIKLIVFGNIKVELNEEFEKLLKLPNIIYVGWQSSDEISKYFLASDLSFFPGKHSVLWEQSAALGLPGIFKKWEGIQHIDVGGNCIFLEEISVSSLKKIIQEIYSDKELYNKMKKTAIEKGIETFSYYEIAKRAINC